MNNKEIATKICNKILEEIEKSGFLPWVKPWGKKPNMVKVIDGYTEITLSPSAWNRNGVEYKGVNTYLPVGEYITFAQCKKEGGSVKSGAHGFPVVYWNFLVKEVEDETTGEKKKEKIPVLKYYTVFNVKDCDGIKQKHQPEPRTVRIENAHYIPVDGEAVELNETAENVVSGYVSRAGNGFNVKREQFSDEAFYSPSADYVKVPMPSQYGDVGEFYSTLFHELAHSTGHETRLNRFTGKAKNAAFGSVEYSKEELVAEITAASVLNAIGLDSANTVRNSAAYVKSWSEKIKSDPLCYVSAANKAQAAFDMILGVEDSTASRA